MGGGGFLGLGPAPRAPDAPDYTGAAQATAAGNLAAAQTQTAANRVSQVTPYGNLDYAQSGTDSAGNPMWTATTSLSPVGQKLLDYQNTTSGQLAGLLGTQFNNVADTINAGFNPSAVPQGVTIPQYEMIGKGPQLQTQLGGTGMAGWDKASQLVMSRLNPQIQHQNEMSDAQLANQGIVPGSEAYANAKRVLAQSQNDLLNQAQLTGQNVQQNLFGQNLAAGQFGNQALNSMYGNTLQGTNLNNTYRNTLFNNQMGANQQAFNQELTKYQLPLNMLNALRTGSQVTNPTFGAVPQQAGTAGADLLGATQMGSNYDLASFNAANAAQGGLNSGLFGLGAAAMMKYSDIRLKQDIKLIGKFANGLNAYEYEYKDAKYGSGKHIGVMAQEVMHDYPHAVHTDSNGYLMVNYGVL